jgi:hypothetical protein
MRGKTEAEEGESEKHSRIGCGELDWREKTSERREDEGGDASFHFSGGCAGRAPSLSSMLGTESLRARGAFAWEVLYHLI